MQIKIGNRIIGLNKTFIVAEISANHSGQLKNIFKLIDKAKSIGADAVKIQTYKPDTITIKSNNKDFIIDKKSPWKKNNTLWKLYQKAHTPWEWHKDIFKYARKKNIILFSSPFDETAIDFLENLNCPAYKIASPEINHIPLIYKAAKTGKPIILSTGLADFKDISLAIKTIRATGNNKIVLLKCTTEYPAPLESINLKTISEYGKKFDVIPGFSDHTIGNDIALASIAFGAKVIEKHIYLRGCKSTIDKFFSINENEFKKLILSIRSVEKAIGKVDFAISKFAKHNLKGRRSIYFSKPIKKNELISRENIKIIRPSYGLNPIFYNKLLGKKATKNFKTGDRVTLKSVKK